MSKIPRNPWDNPSPTATARVVAPLPIPLNCHYCKNKVQLVNNSEIYQKQYGEWPYAYLCSNKQCGAYVGLHPFTSIPLGTLADAHTRRARKNTKEAFNAIWKGGHMTRDGAYQWLAEKMGITDHNACHISWMNVVECKAAFKFCRDFFNQPQAGEQHHEPSTD
jgi:hypothetical protein